SPDEGKEALPRQTTLAAATHDAPPTAQQPIAQSPQPPQVTGNCMVVVEPLQDPSQPAADLARVIVEPPAQWLLDLRELNVHPLGHRYSLQLKPAVATCDTADMREPQKIKRRRPALAVATTPRVSVTTKWNQPCLVRMQR